MSYAGTAGALWGLLTPEAQNLEARAKQSEDLAARFRREQAESDMAVDATYSPVDGRGGARSTNRITGNRSYST